MCITKSEACVQMRALTVRHAAMVAHCAVQEQLWCARVEPDMAKHVKCQINHQRLALASRNGRVTQRGEGKQTSRSMVLSAAVASRLSAGCDWPPMEAFMSVTPCRPWTVTLCTSSCSGTLGWGLSFQGWRVAGSGGWS